MNEQYSIEDQVNIVLFYGYAAGHARLAARLYAETFPNVRHPSHSTVARIVNRLRTTGSVRAKKRKRKSAVDEASETAILAYVTLHPRTSVRHISKEAAVSKSSVWKILRKHNFHPYHVSPHQGLCNSDFEKRSDFCNSALIKLEEESNFLRNILWTDEAKFSRNGHVNLHNAHIWSERNPHWLRQQNHQVHWSFNVWCGIYNDQIVGPYFYDENLTSSFYVNRMLRGLVDDFTSSIPLTSVQAMWFQHDGAPPHASGLARAFLDANFPGRWIGRDGPVPWPAKSPCLNPLDFFGGGLIKNKGYEAEPRSKVDLQRKIICACRAIEPWMLKRVVASVHDRLLMCVAAEGQHLADDCPDGR